MMSLRTRWLQAWGEKLKGKHSVWSSRRSPPTPGDLSCIERDPLSPSQLPRFPHLRNVVGFYDHPRVRGRRCVASGCCS